MSDSIGTSSTSRRRLLATGAALTALSLTPRLGAARQATPAASPVPEYPRTIGHAMGETTLDTQPLRIATTGDFVDLDYVLAFGVEPVIYGFTNAWSSGAMPWQGAAAELTSFDASTSIDLEALVAAEPDLIVGMIATEDDYKNLSAIAPTIMFPWDIDWRTGLRSIGAALGLDARAEELIAGVETELAIAKEALAPVAAKPFMVGFQYSTEFYIWGPETASGKLFLELGLNFIGGGEPGLMQTSLEEVIVLDQAEILLSVNSDPAAIEVQEASPLFQNLKPVKNGGYDLLTVQQSRSLGDGLSPLSLPWGMPQFVELMLRLGEGGGKRLG